MTAVRRVATFRLDEDLREGLQTIWVREGIPPSEQVRRAIRAWLETKGIRTARPKRRSKAAEKG